MRELLQSLADGLNRLAEAGNVRPGGENLLSGLRVTVGQLLEVDASNTKAAADARPDPVEVQLEALSARVADMPTQFTALGELLIEQLSALASDIQAMKGA